MKPMNRIFMAGLLLSIASITTGQAEDFYRLDEAVPVNSDTAKYAPVFDFDGNGCLPSAGISREGEKNPGLNTTGWPTGDCRSDDFLETSNTIHRYACTNKGGSKYCGHFYALYFEKDQCYDINAAVPDPVCGHRHDWEVTAVWTTDGVITHVCASAHGNCDPAPASSRLFLDDHVMIVYHRDSIWTHAFRFANTDDYNNPENPYGSWVTPTVASWYELTGDSLSNQDMRDALNIADYGAATIPMKDKGDTFLINLNKWKPSGYPFFSQASIEASNPEPSLAVRVEALENQMETMMGAYESLQVRVTDLEAAMELLSNHTHEYLTGKGKGHNNAKADTGPPIPGGGQ